MSQSLNKAKELSKKTNAAVIVVNETNDDAFVVVTMSEYERLVEGQGSDSKERQETKEEKSIFEMRKQKLEERAPTLTSPDQPKTSMESFGTSALKDLTEEELLARMNQEIAEWRAGQTDKENIVLAEIPAQLSLKNQKGTDRGGFNLASEKVDFRVDNLEEEERFFLEPLD